MNGTDPLDGGCDTCGPPDSDGCGAVTSTPIDRTVDPRTVWTTSRARRVWIAGGFLVAGLLLPVSWWGGTVVLAVRDYTVVPGDASLVAAVVLAATPIVRNGLAALRERTYNVDALEAIAILAATALGMFVEAAVLAVLIGIAHLLEDYAVARTRASLNELVDLAPETARLRRDGTAVPVETVAEDEVVVAKPGEKVPLDGTVVEGQAAVDESPITGESVPVDKAPGDDVYAGTFVENGYVELAVTAESGDTTLARIVDAVQEARSNRAEVEQYVDRLAAYYTPLVVAGAVLVATVPPLVAGGPWRSWVVRGLTLLVIACPCAFVISTPVTVFAALSSAAKGGVLVKGGKYLEALADVDVVALDKTGTLTRGTLAVSDVVPAPDADESTLLEIAAGIESRSDHPVATAIVEHAEARGVDRSPVSGFETLVGSGVRATVDGATHCVGKPSLFDGGGPGDPGVHPDGGRRVGVASPRLEPGVVDSLRQDGKTVVLVGSEARVLGAIALRDEVRPGAKPAIDRLRGAGVETVVLTGDNEATAGTVAGDVGADEYRAGLLPGEKVDAVEALEARGDVTAMVGDGVNDAPALAAASVGVAMGAAGTDTAVETADVALMGDDLERIPDTLGLGRSGLRVIKENVWASLLVEGLLFVAASVGLVGPILAVLLGDAGLTLAVTGNALRLASGGDIDGD